MSYQDLLSKAQSTNEKELLELDISLRTLMENNKTLTYTQLRSILTVIKKEQFLSKSIHKLAYIQARQEKQEAKLIVEFIRELMEVAANNENRNAFEEILNTIVAYHKFYSK